MRPCPPAHDWRPNDWHRHAERTRLTLYTQPRQRIRAAFGSYATPVSSSINMQHIRLASVPDCHDQCALQHSTVTVFCTPGGNLRRRIPSDKPTLYGSPLCRVTVEVPKPEWPRGRLCALLYQCLRCRAPTLLGNPSLTRGGASVVVAPTSLGCPVNLGYSAPARQ